MAKQTKLNPEGHLLAFGPNVRLERDMDKPHPDSKVVWILFKKVDVSADEDTTYDYRFDEVSRHDETEAGEPPQSAIDAANALAGE